ncbi:MAG TPA: formyltransferase family protein [Acidobacteriaceae bacterium]|nr:formyltransferase family protein [Acidobacteriaceae bacterium]
MKRVVLLGKGDLAIRIANWFLHSDKYTLAEVVPVMPEPSWTASLSRWARENGVPIVESGHYRDLRELQAGDGRVDLAMSVFYDKIIREWFIQRCRRIINLHNGPLPKYRGVSPINWALKNEEYEHGVTIHEITPGIDDGPIVGQVKYSIYPAFDEVVDVYRRSLEYGWTLFQQTAPLLDRIQPREQEHDQATYYSKLDNPQLGDRSGFTRAHSQPHAAVTAVNEPGLVCQESGVAK